MSIAVGRTLPVIRDRHWAFDFAYCAFLQVFCVGLYLFQFDGSLSGDSGLIGIGASFLLTATVLIRRQFAHAAIIIAAAMALNLAVAASTPTLSIVVVPIIVYSAARWTDHTWARIALGLAMFGSVVGPTRWVFQFGFDTERVAIFIVTAFACAAISTGAYLFGRRRSEWAENAQQRAQAEAERQQLLIAEQAQRDRAATITERQRIARELHDIVAHSLSVIVVQAEGGKAMATKRPERAPEVLGTIAETSRQALVEMRQMVRLLRGETADNAGAEYVPTPGLDDLADLVQRTSELAEFNEYGDRPAVNPALGLTTYRIVQESLTNVLKHAGPNARSWVRIAYTPGSIELEITDDGRGAASTSDGQGNGLRGMFERVGVHGGRLSAQPRPGGGFVVRASLPVHG